MGVYVLTSLIKFLITGLGSPPACKTTCTRSLACTTSYFSTYSSGISSRMLRCRREMLDGRNPGAGYCSEEMSKPWSVALGYWRWRSRSQILYIVVSFADRCKRVCKGELLTQCRSLHRLWKCRCCCWRRGIGWMGEGDIRCSLSRCSVGD